MPNTPPVKQLLGGTRGEVLTLVCSSPRTIKDLADELGLTANAIRGHLNVLERDGMVRRTVLRQGVGKPAHVYEATPGGRGLLSRAYQPALSAILGVLVERMPPNELEMALREAGHRLGLPHVRAGGDVLTRIRVALRVLEDLGSVARVEKGDGENTYMICGQCCPLADLVAEHPEVCVMVESMLTDIIGMPVREHCRSGPVPSCRFLVARTPERAE